MKKCSSHGKKGTAISVSKSPPQKSSICRYPSVVNMIQRMGLGDPLERDCRVDEVCGDWLILKRLEKVAINLDEMEYLAKRLDSFDAQEKAKFQAVAVKYGLFDMRHLIDLSF